MAESRREVRTRRRFARRQWARRWLTWKPLVAAVALVALLVGAVWLVFFSSYLSVQGVQVEGAQEVSAAEVRRAAAVVEGDPLARVDLDRIRSRVESLAAVKSADVSRSWPDEVLVVVDEREPIAVVEIGDQRLALDEEGKDFEVSASTLADLPRVQTSSNTGSEARAEGALVVAALPDDLAARVDHVAVETVDEITLVLRDGREVQWGSAEASEQKAAVLADLLIVQQTKDAARYDVSVPGLPTTS